MKRVVVLSFLLAMVPVLAFGQHWAGPYQLTNDTFVDVKPAACPEWVAGWNTYLVWQTNRNGNWDIYAKFCMMMGGNGWGADESVSVDSADDVNPAVAACNDQLTDHPSFWCVWERRESSLVGSIWASFITFREDWQAPESVGRYIHTGGDSAEPRVIVIRNNQVDTAWVTWTCHDTDGWRVEYAYHAGDSWYGPLSAVTSADPIRHARLGRGYHDRYYGCPLLVWETGGDIFYAEYLDGSWSAPQEVAHSEALDRNPDIVSHSWFPFDGGPWITWESVRDGDTAIYGTAMDTFSIGRRWCDSVGGGNNYAPCGTPAAYTVDFWEDAAVAWVTDRNGNPDIYARTWFFEDDEFVDNDPATDINPTLTTLGLTEHWCVWQSNRSGNWDLYGSFIYVVGVEEGQPQASSSKPQATVLHRLPVGAAAFDAMGRRVLDPKPGVYFLREGRGTRGEVLGEACKVIIQR